MHRLVYFLLLTIGICCVYKSEAQIRPRYKANSFYLSPTDKRLDRFNFDIENLWGDILHHQSALYEMQNKEGDFLHHSTQSDSLTSWHQRYLSITHASGNIDGDYLPDEGNAFAHSAVDAQAVHNTLKHGSIQGEASFAKGLHRGYAWNAIRHAELYRPYLLLDSTGGDYKYENYYLSGAYAFRIQKIYCGLNASFRGEIATRQTDPRCANTTMWVKIGSSVAGRINNRHWIATRIHYLRNKQHLDLWNWRTMQQDRFFYAYGFGYFDLKESPTFFGVKRMYYIQGAEAQITYSNLKSHVQGQNHKLMADVYYKFQSMKTEEQDAKNLFGSNTHQLNIQLLAGLWQNSQISFQSIVQSKNRFRFGKENIYENFCPDPNYPSIYDFRLINTRKRYTDIFSNAKWLNKLSYLIPQHHLRIEIAGGIAFDYISTNYSKPQQSWNVTSLYPMVGLGAKQRLKGVEWSANSLCFIKKPQTYSYNVAQEDYKLDYQTTFLPYAYYTDASFNWCNELYARFNLKNIHNSIGIALRHYWRKGHRSTDIIYNAIPNIQSSVLSIPKTGKVENMESYFSLSLFVSL